ncbi:MAG: hypothetical protein AAGG75_13640 [Bacteroidota bacterium]
MLVLYELINMLPLSFEPTFSKRLNDLFFLLKKEKLTEAEAAARLIGDNLSRKYFNKIKNDLRKALVNYIMVYPSTWADTKQKQLCDHCYKNFTIYKTLLLSGQRTAAIEIASSILTKAISAELFEVAYTIASDLEYHYSAINIKTSAVRKYTQLANQFLQLVDQERIVRYQHNRIKQIHLSSKSITAADITSFEEAIEVVSPLIQLNSPKLNRLIYDIIVMRYYATYHYAPIVHYCDEAIATFPSSHPNFTALKFNFLQRKIPALIALGSTSEAKIIAKQAGQMVSKGTFNWHLILIQRVEACFHNSEFQEAYELYKAHAKYGCRFSILTEYWLIIRAYLYFFIQIGRITPYSEERFNLGKFLNEIPFYSRDKSGVNINILIVQILVQIQREQFGRIIDRIDALRAYAHQHTRSPETARAYLFIQMIIKMEAASFHRAATERKTKKLLDKLQNTPLRIGQNIAVEMVPFDFLWQEILALLANKFRGIKLNKHPTRRGR